ncbi:MAG: hypothetical protein KAG97_11995, partial [Victivallales bacterium]|nr:hypothetical protein [Victivallales bacterium]
MNPSGIFCVIPSTLAVGEEFSIKVKVIGEIRVIKSANFAWKPFMPKLAGPFNRCVARKIQYIDNVLPEWNGKLVVNAEDALQGQDTLVFDGVNQGVFDGDMRPIREFRGFSWKTPG